MPNYRRRRVAGGTFFLTVNLAQRGSTLLLDRLSYLEDAIHQTQLDHPFEMQAYVLLPDHLHWIWRLPKGDSNYSVRVGAIKSRFSRSCRRAGFIPPPPTGQKNGGVNPALRRKGEVGLWQPRFWEHTIRDDRDYWAHMHYCWMNPVKHGYVARPELWPHTSPNLKEAFHTPIPS